jgi:hypothetical protein
MECKFCKNTFSTKYSLKYHQQKVKRCLKAQGKMPTEEYQCDICKEKIDSKTSFNFHVNLCERNDLIKKNKELQETVEKLKKEILKLKKENVRNKKITLNPITDDMLSNLTKNLRTKHLENGKKEFALFLVENGLKDKIICSDVYRSHFVFFYKGEKILDKDSSKLFTILFSNREFVRKILYIIEVIQDKNLDCCKYRKQLLFINNLNHDIKNEKIYTFSDDVKQLFRCIGEILFSYDFNEKEKILYDEPVRDLHETEGEYRDNIDMEKELEI